MRRGHPPSRAEALPRMEPQELPSTSLLRAPAYPKECGRQAAEAEQEIKTRIKRLRVIASELERPPAQFEA